MVKIGLALHSSHGYIRPINQRVTEHLKKRQKKNIMTTVKFTVIAKIFDGVQTIERQVERTYTVEWHKGYAGIRNKDGYFVQDISLKGLETKEERMQHVIDTLKSWK